MAQLGIIVGTQVSDINTNEKAYRIVLFNKGENGVAYSRQVATEEAVIKALKTGALKLDNAVVKDNKLYGQTGSLSRFNPSNGIRPMVVISEIVAEGNTIGYRLANYDGKISAVRLKDVLAYCARVEGKGTPIQNAMYVADSGETKAHIRLYPYQELRKEVINRKKSSTAQPAKVDKKANEKQVSKLEELFSPAQIEQLKLGKLHGVDIRVFGNNKLSADQMKELRTALESGINAKAFADPAYSVEAMKALRINAKYGVDITYFVNPKYNAAQIYELSTGFLAGVDISQYADPSLSAKDMSKKRVYLESQLWNEVQAQ